MTTTPAPTPADRESAAKLYEMFPALSSCQEGALKTAEFIRSGGADGWNTVHLFRDHRLQAEARMSRMREALEEIAKFAAERSNKDGDRTFTRPCHNALVHIEGIALTALGEQE